MGTRRGPRRPPRACGSWSACSARARRRRRRGRGPCGSRRTEPCRSGRARFAWRGPEVISYRAMNTRPRQQILTLIAIALTFASGANDVASFTRLGGVFTSVMTGNLVLWGLSAAQRSISLFSHTAVSIGGYISGVAGGTWVAHGFKVHGNGKPDDTDRASVLPGHVSWALFTELVLLAGFTAGWEVTGARPAGWAEFVLLAVLAAAMGMQSSSVNEMGLTNVSTTFLTGTLTGLVSSLVRPGQHMQQ